MTLRLYLTRVQKNGERQAEPVTADLMGSILSLTLDDGQVLILDATQLIGFLMEPGAA